MNSSHHACISAGSPPRGWGKRIRVAPCHDSGNGSPPRGWGKRSTFRSGVFPPRFTPTRVGKTTNSPIRCTPSTVHPHAGGENPATRFLSSGRPGSPPRGWGKLLPSASAPAAERFTPTRVGKTASCLAPARIIRFTPTRVGKTLGTSGNIIVAAGSPPRGWGKRKQPTGIRVIPYGSPPRGWGKRGTLEWAPEGTAVHPHAGGENLQPGGARVQSAGSPPRGWGKPDPNRQIACCERFTPTRVGKT